MTMLVSISASASVDECFKDARSHGSHHHAVSPDVSCADVIRNHPKRIERKTSDGSLHVYGLKTMFYADHYSEGKFVQRKLMAGEQTEFEEILDISLNEKKKKILVRQRDSISVFGFDLIGNMVPASKYISNFVGKTKKAILLDDEDMIALISEDGARFINANAESRYDTPDAKPKVIYEFKDQENNFHVPLNALYLKDANAVVIHSDDKVFVYKLGSNTPFLSIKAAPGSLVRKSNKEAILIHKTGEHIKIPIDK